MLTLGCEATCVNNVSMAESATRMRSLREALAAACQKTGVIVLTCGVKISAVHCLVLSSTRVTDRQRQTDRQNFDS